jgi:DNA excision repair protein ERCC-8
MNSFLLNRQLGSITPQALASAQNRRLVQSLHLAPKVQFTEHADQSSQPKRGNLSNQTTKIVAHGAGVSSIVIDRFEGR